MYVQLSVHGLFGKSQHYKTEVPAKVHGGYAFVTRSNTVLIRQMVANPWVTIAFDQDGNAWEYLHQTDSGRACYAKLDDSDY